EAHAHMKKMAEGMAESVGARCEFEIRNGYPFLVNEEKLTSSVRSFAEDFLDKENVVDVDFWLAAEDLAYYSQQADARFHRIGIRNEELGATSAVHTPPFGIVEGAFQLSTWLLAYICIKQLRN